MKKNTRVYIEKNEKQYEYYIKKVGRWMSMFISCLWILVIGVQMWIVRGIFLNKNALEEVDAEAVGNMEVMDWVSQQVKQQNTGVMALIIWGMIVLMILLVVVIYLSVKSYDLYKKKWVRWMPLVFIGILVGIIFSEFKKIDVLGIVVIVIDLFMFASNFTLFLPPEIRKSCNKAIDIASILGNFITKRR